MSKQALSAKNKATVPRGLRYLSFAAPIFIILLASLYAHIRLSQSGEDYTGPLAILDRVFDLSLAAGLMMVAFLTGRKLCRLMRLSFASLPEEISFSIMLGTGVTGLAALALALIGLLRPLPMAALMLALIFVSYREATTLLSVLKGLFHSGTRTRSRLILAILFSALVAILAVRALTPPHSFDEAIYHLPVAKSFVERGRIYPTLDNWAGNMPFLVQMIYAICLMAKSDIAAKLFSLGLAVACSFSLYGFCARFVARRAGIIAMFGFFASGMVVEVAVTTRIDVTLAFALFLATYAMIIYLETSAPGWLWASAILSGLALGIKYTAGIWILLLAVMYLFESLIRKPVSWASVMKRGFLYAAIAAAVACPWYIKNFAWFNNPVYPFVTGEAARFDPEPLRYFTAEDESKLERYYVAARREVAPLVDFRKQELAFAASQRVERHPLRFWEYFTRPDAYNMAEDYHYPNYLFLLTPLLVFLPKRRWFLWLAFFSIVFFLAATSTSWVGRVLLPIYPGLTLISACALAQMADRANWTRRANLKTALPAIVLTIAVGFIALLSILQIYEKSDVDFIAGKLSRRSYMSSVFYYPPLDFINHELPQSAKVMMLGAQMSYGMERGFIADVNWDSTEWRRLLTRNDSLKKVSEDLKQRGVTHILFTDSLFKWVALMGRENYPNISGPTPGEGPDYQVQLRNWVIFNRFSMDFLEPVYTDGMGFMVYKIK